MFSKQSLNERRVRGAATTSICALVSDSYGENQSVFCFQIIDKWENNAR